MLTSDRHWDNPHSDRELQKKHLDQAIERDALVFDFGDFFCLMQGKYDKRASKSAVRPEHQVDNYIDAVIEDAAQWFKPYRKHLRIIGVGNHESAITKRLEVNPIERFVSLLNASGGHAYNGGYSGWITLNFSSKLEHEHGLAIRIRYDHGYGGGGIVTADMIQHQRRALLYPDAQIVVSGHTHDAWSREFGRQRIDRKGITFQDVQTHIKLPTYKDDFGDGYGGWHVETGKPPKPLGAYWLRFYYACLHRKYDRIYWDVIRAGRD